MNAEAIEEAYREGFDDGVDQMIAYEWAHAEARTVARCWEESEAKAELDKTEAERFTEHLEQASRIVASWPAWKRNLLDNPSNEPRKPC